MFCPVCKSEYRDGFSMCADCNVPLVAELPPEKEESETHHNDKGVLEIGRYSNPAKVSFINSLFEAEQIDFYFLGDHAVLDGLLFGGGHSRLFVAKDDESRAVELLRNISFDDKQWPFK